jgi:hypothetical protein
MAPMTQRTAMVGSASTVQSRSVMSPAGAVADPIAALAGTGRASIDEKSKHGRSGSHGPRRRSPCSEPPHPLYGARGRDSLCQSRATGSDLSRSHFVSSRSSSNIPGRKTAPYGWIDGYLRRICNRGCRPGSLPLLGLGLPGLLNRLQRREILHQKPVGKNVTTDFAQKDALGRVSRKPKLTAHQVEMARGLLESGKPPRDWRRRLGRDDPRCTGCSSWWMIA